MNNNVGIIILNSNTKPLSEFDYFTVIKSFVSHREVCKLNEDETWNYIFHESIILFSLLENHTKPVLRS